MIPFEHLVVLNELIGITHADMILDFLKRNKTASIKIDLIASHGQTVYHAPKAQHSLKNYPNATLQIGDGDHIAVKTGIITLSDFRQKHIAVGGEGAPLAAYGDYFLFSSPEENRIMLNMGGIANFTFLPASLRAEDVFVTDTGPGNTLLDACMQNFFPGKSYDKDAEIASKGKINEALLNMLLQHDYFKLKTAGTTGPEVFNLAFVAQAQEKSNTKNISVEDLLATLTAFSAQTISEAISYKLSAISQKPSAKIYMSGGGAHNPLIVSMLKNLLPDYKFGITDELGINGDAKEAVLFATLANECVAGEKKSLGSGSGAFFFPSVSMGKISLPE